MTLRLTTGKLNVAADLWPTLQGTNISPLKVAGKMIFLFHKWDMLVPRRVCQKEMSSSNHHFLKGELTAELSKVEGLMTYDSLCKKHGSENYSIFV